MMRLATDYAFMVTKDTTRWSVTFWRGGTDFLDNFGGGWHHAIGFKVNRKRSLWLFMLGTFSITIRHKTAGPLEGW